MADYLARTPKLPILFSFSSFKGKKDVWWGKLKEYSLLEEEEEDMVVPKGFMAVYVGPEMRRFVIPTNYLRLPAFQTLMERVAEEFGYEQTGGLRIPCEEEDFEEILRALKNSDSRTKKKKKNKKKNKKKKKKKKVKNSLLRL